MTGNAASRVRGAPVPIASPPDTLTHVELTSVERRIENTIRFGRQAGEQVLDHHRRIISFRPGSVFAFVRRTTNDLGTIVVRIDIVRAVASGEACQTLPFVRPGGDILLTIDGPARVDRLLRYIDAIEAAGIDACDVAPDHWRHVGNRMAAGDEPRAYTIDRHRAWLARREIER